MSDWQRALVTGASSGIGAAFARRLAGAGSDLVLVARSADRLADDAEVLRTRHGVAVEVIAADVTDHAQVDAVVRRLQAVDQPIDLLVNNAGIGASGAFDQTDLDRALDQIDLNVVALVRLTHAALPGMRARRRGGVINVSSLSALQPYPYGAVYGASKAFVNSFSAALHAEARDDGVSVLAVCPGFTRTNFQAAAGIAHTPIPDWMWLEPTAVVDDALTALAAGRPRRVVGRPYRVWAAATRVLPQATVSRLLARAGRHRT